MRAALPLLLLFLASAAPVARAAEPAPIRIGIALERERLLVLADAAQLEIPERADPLTLAGETLLAWLAPRSLAPPSYRIQVAALASESEADRSAQQLARLVPGSDVVRDAETGVFRVRAGNFSSREEALDALGGVAGRFPSAFVVEVAAPGGPARLRLLLAARGEVVDTAGPIRIVPHGAGLLALDGKRYRGMLELRRGAKAGLVAVNQLDVEEYLRGVVPLEMGPEVYPELEALKAQAVAARSYAEASRGGFPADAYDLCATPRCQVYGGADAEAALTDRAVDETRGWMLVAPGAAAPIRAYFSATCGGHTEEVSLVFEGEARSPYLRAVECAPGQPAGSVLPRGLTLPAGRGEDGRLVAESVASLLAAGVLEQPPAAERLRAAIGPAEWRGLLERAARSLGVASGVPRLSPVLLERELLTSLVEGLGLEERGQVLYHPADLRALGRFRDASSLSAAERRAVAVLQGLDALPVFADGGVHPGSRPSRAVALTALARTLRALGRPALLEATFVGLEGGEVVWRRRGEERRSRIDARTAVLRSVQREWLPLGPGRLQPGDPLRLAIEGERLRLLLLDEQQAGGDDRRARDTRWTLTLEREELEARLRPSHVLGTLRDVEVLRRGASGRPVETRFVGSKGEAVLFGYSLKRLLNLKDDLVVLEELRDGSGELRAVRFAGRGWGHGVGLCQEGAYGMSLRGESFRAILERYYPEATLSSGAGSAASEGR